MCQIWFLSEYLSFLFKFTAYFDIRVRGVSSVSLSIECHYFSNRWTLEVCLGQLDEYSGIIDFLCLIHSYHPLRWTNKPKHKYKISWLLLGSLPLKSMCLPAAKTCFGQIGGIVARASYPYLMRYFLELGTVALQDKQVLWSILFMKSTFRYLLCTYPHQMSCWFEAVFPCLSLLKVRISSVGSEY